MSNEQKTLTQERAKDICIKVAAGKSHGNIKWLLSNDEHQYVMNILRKTKERYFTIIYNIAYPKP